MYYKEEDIVIRTGIKEDIKTISKIASKYSKEIGFVMNVVLEESCETKTLYTVLYKNEIVGFCNFNIRNKDKVCVMFDDIIDTAGTICEAARMLKEQGAKDANAEAIRQQEQSNARARAAEERL